jgi:ornithine cyclodeaminase
MQEIPTGIVDQCTVIYDTTEALTVGDLKHWNSSKTMLPLPHMHMLGQVLLLDQNSASSSAPPRDANKPYTFFKSVGTAVQDVCTANMVLKKARELQLGIEITL